MRGAAARTTASVDCPQAETPLYLETSDVARVLEMSYSGVYAMVESGRLKPAGRTMRGVRLFLAQEIAAFKALRDELRRQKGVAPT